LCGLNAAQGFCCLSK